MTRIQEVERMADSRVIATVVRIQAMPAIVVEHLVSSLAQEGVDGSVVATNSGVEVQVPGAEPASLSRRVAAALDSLVLREGRPLVPEQVGPTSFVLRPAAG